VDNCWPAIVHDFPLAKLVVAGMNPSSAIKKLSKDKRIEITGFVDNIMPYFHAATVFIAPFQIARGVQNKVLQAMSCQIPVVSTTRGIEGIIHENNVDVFIADTAQEFIRKCKQLSTSPDLREKTGNAARQRILASYAWSEVLKPLTDRIEIDK
jgi:glycosyltransferase involved in cell wall biosynthesis